MLKLVLVLYSCFGVVSFGAADSILIRSISIVDGTGAQKTGPLDIEITGNRISRIGANLKTKAGKIIDGHGKFAIPGLIDTHTHLHSVPGSVFRKDSENEIQRQQVFQLKAYLAAGVTTVLDAAAPESLFKEISEGKNTSPRVLALAPFLTPQGGYFASVEARGKIYSDLWTPLVDETSADAHFEKAARLNALGTKVTLEKGFGPFEVWPIFDESFRSTIVAKARKYNSPLFIHSMSKEEHRLALSMQPYALVHAGFDDQVADAEIIQEIKNSVVYVSTTLAIYKMMLLMWDSKTLNEPWIRMLVPPEQIETALNVEATKKVVEKIVLDSKPWWVPKFLARLLSGLFLNQAIIEKQLARSQKSVALMQEAGIPLVMGSDAGNWPVWSTFFHGVGSILEVEALHEAGLSPMEVIIASTSRAAKLLKMDSEIGKIGEGMIADIIILNEDPLTNPTAYRNLNFVIKDGVAKTPAEWLL